MDEGREKTGVMNQLLSGTAAAPELGAAHSDAAAPFRKVLEAFANDPILKGLKRRSSWRDEVPELRKSQAASPPAAEEPPGGQPSAGEVVRWLADLVQEWRAQVCADEQPAIVAMLNGGVQLKVDRISQESFHAIRIEGTIRDNPCTLLAHPATLQLLCYIEKVEQPGVRRRIGFVIDGHEQQL
jgi:hypothetical protein